MERRRSPFVAVVLDCQRRVNEMVALTGAAAVVVLPVITSHDIFYSHDTESIRRHFLLVGGDDHRECCGKTGVHTAICRQRLMACRYAS